MLRIDHVERMLCIALGVPAGTFGDHVESLGLTGRSATPADAALLVLAATATDADDCDDHARAAARLPFVAHVHERMAMDRRGRRLCHDGGLFDGPLGDVLARLMCDPMGDLVATVAVTTGPHFFAEMTVKLPDGGFSGVDVLNFFYGTKILDLWVQVSEGLARGPRRTTTVALHEPTIQLLRDLFAHPCPETCIADAQTAWAPETAAVRILAAFEERRRRDFGGFRAFELQPEGRA